MKTKEHLASALVILAVLGVLFAGVITAEYGHTDDYSQLFFIGSGSIDVLANDITAMGRPLASLAWAVLFTMGDSLETLRDIRFMGLIGLALLTLFVVQLYSEAGFRAKGGVLCALLILMNPATGVYVAWATTSLFLYAALIAAYAGYLFQRCLDSFREHRHRAIWLGLLSALLVLGSLCIYQPTVFFFLTPVLIRETLRKEEAAARLFIPWMHLVLLGGLMVAYYVAYKLSLTWVGTDTWASQRGNINGNPFHQLDKLIEFPFLATLSSWALFQGPIVLFLIRLVVAVGVILGMTSLLRKGKTLVHRLNLLVFVAAAYGMASSLGLFLDVGTIPFRMFPFQYILTGHLVILGYLFAYHRLTGTSTRRVLAGVAVMALVYQLASAHWVVTEGIVRPNAREYQAYRTYIQERFEKEVPPFCAFIFPLGPAECRVPQLHEYGYNSSSLDWVPHPILTFLFRENAGLPPVPPNKKDAGATWMVRIYPWQERNLEHMQVVDGHEVLTGLETPPAYDYEPDPEIKRGRFKEEDPYFGTVEQLNNKWIYVEKLGYMQRRPPPRFWHWSLGFILVKPSGLWIYVDPNKWLHTTLEEFPIATEQETGDKVEIFFSGYQDYRTVKLDNSSSNHGT